MELFYSPGACSIGIHVLLEEIGRPFGLRKLDFKNQEQSKPEFAKINPKGKVPALMRDDGSVLTEFPAIATWLALINRHKRLLPEDVEGHARALEAMDYIVSTVHMQGFTRIFRPERFTPNGSDHDAVKAIGRELVDKGLAAMDKALQRQDYLTGSFSVADAALFYVELWAAERLRIPLPPHCAAHYARMKARPSVQRVLQKEGFAA